MPLPSSPFLLAMALTIVPPLSCLLLFWIAVGRCCHDR